MTTELTVTLANPRGFCAGVERAIAIVDAVLERYPAPIYVRHAIVHNKHVVAQFEKQGVVFVEDIQAIPDGEVAIFSAHGVSQEVRDIARKKQLTLFDATCPLVTKVHLEVTKYAQEGQDCILIGHAGHPEVEGTLGQYFSEKGRMYLVQTPEQAEALVVNQPENLGFVTQTTLSVDETKVITDILQKRFPLLKAPRKEDICYATQNRQQAVRLMLSDIDLLLVVGSKNSSNSNRLKDLAALQGKSAYLIDDAQDIQWSWLEGKTHIGLTAGASAPEHLIQAVLSMLRERYSVHVKLLEGIEENMHFSMPVTLRRSASSSSANGESD